MSKRRVGTRGVPRAEREAQIRDAALALFGSQGHALVSVSQIAARADVSKALVLSYFGSKDALYLTCLRDLLDRLVPATEAAVRGSTPGLPMALDSLLAMADVIRERPSDWGLLTDTSVPPGSDLAAATLVERERLGHWGGVGIRALLGDAADPLDNAALTHLWRVIVDGVMAWWQANPDETPESVVSRFARISATVFAHPLSTRVTKATQTGRAASH